MSLIDCAPHDLTGSVFHGAPEVLTRRRVLYVPRTRGGADEDFGLFEETGRLILGSALFSTQPPRLKSQSIVTARLRDDRTPSIPHAIYGGAIGAHYGHFITECLNTLWYFMAHGGPEDRILFHSDLTPMQIWATPWMADLLRHAGLRPEQVLVPGAPVTIERLIVPGQAFSEDGFVYRAFAECCGALGEAMLADEDIAPAAPVYLSRTLIQAGTRVLMNEQALVEAFARRGIRSVAPETLSVPPQVALFSRSPVIGMMGSAFHTSILARRPRGVVLCADPMPFRTYPLMDAAHDASFAYVHETDLKDAAQVAGFAQAFALPDPEAAADALLARLRQQQQSPRPPGHRAASPLLRGDLRLWALQTAAGEPIARDPACQRVSVCESVGPGDTLMLLLTIGDVGFLCAGASDLPAIAIDGETLASSVLSYRLDHLNDAITLRHPQTGRWLRAPPSGLMAGLACDADTVRDWEKFRLAPAELHGAQGRLALVLDALRSVARGDYPHGAPEFVLDGAMARLIS